ncbi:MAG TPA: methyltransferase domain-containing protein [Kiloniellaceae bacterium]
MDIQYPDEFIDRLHLIWGDAFLSPGGPEEVRAIVSGLDLEDGEVLDIGCGTGGPAIVLARDKGARVTAVDIEPQLLERGRRFAEKAGVADRVDFRLVEPGPLPFAAGRFDAVFSKDALIHIPDKQGLYAEVLRVLRPGGAFAASDWLAGEGALDDPAFRRYVDLGHLKFTMATAEETAAIMRESGFAEVVTRDRNAWYAEVSAGEAAAIAGPLREQIIAVSDRATYERWRDGRRALAEATRKGSLRPTHLRGKKP